MRWTRKLVTLTWAQYHLQLTKANHALQPNFSVVSSWAEQEKSTQHTLESTMGPPDGMEWMHSKQEKSLPLTALQNLKAQFTTTEIFLHWP